MSTMTAPHTRTVETLETADNRMPYLSWGLAWLVETLLWPAGSGLVIGLCYLAGGAATRDVLQYALGSWLALVTGASLLLDTPSTYAVLAVLGSAGYLTAAVLEPRRRALTGARTTEGRQS